MFGFKRRVATVQVRCVYQSHCLGCFIVRLLWHPEYLVLLMSCRKDLVALSHNMNIVETGYRSCLYY